MATRFTHRDARLEQRAAPCKKCGWRALCFADGEDYIEFGNPACGQLMTEDEYTDWAREFTEDHGMQRAA